MPPPTLSISFVFKSISEFLMFWLLRIVNNDQSRYLYNCFVFYKISTLILYVFCAIKLSLVILRCCYEKYCWDITTEVNITPDVMPAISSVREL